MLGLTALQAGLWTIPSALGYLAGSMLAPVAARRMPRRRMMSASLLLTASGFGLLTQAGGVAVIVAGSVIFSLGLAPIYVLTTELTVAAAPPERSGTASGILETGANLGGALGITVLGSIAGAVYRDAMPPGTAQTLGEAARSGLADVGPAGVHRRLPQRRARRRGAAARPGRRQRAAPARRAGAGPAATTDSRAKDSSSS